MPLPPPAANDLDVARALGRRRLATRRHRTRLIRRRVIAATAAIFIALFSTIYVQMAAGRDPALGHGTTQAATSTSAAALPPDDYEDDDEWTTESSPAPMTTQQS